ncbi:hypothetical protein D9M71_682560 [compost metagenome]
MLVDIAGEHHHVGIYLGQRAQAAEVFVMQVGKDADAHGGSYFGEWMGHSAHNYPSAPSEALYAGLPQLLAQAQGFFIPEERRELRRTSGADAGEFLPLRFAAGGEGVPVFVCGQ